jgi:hypothetical protein
MQTEDSSRKLVTLYWTAGHLITKHYNQDVDFRTKTIANLISEYVSYNDMPSDQLHFYLHDATAPCGPGQPDAETSTWQHTTLTRDKHPRPRRGSNSQSQQASGRRRPATYKFQIRLLLQNIVTFRWDIMLDIIRVCFQIQITGTVHICTPQCTRTPDTFSVSFRFNKTNRRTNFPRLFFVKKLYMFRAVPLPIIRSFPLYIRHWYMSCRFDDIHQCRMYSGKILMIGKGTARNM